MSAFFVAALHTNTHAHTHTYIYYMKIRTTDIKLSQTHITFVFLCVWQSVRLPIHKIHVTYLRTPLSDRSDSFLKPSSSVQWYTNGIIRVEFMDVHSISSQRGIEFCVFKVIDWLFYHRHYCSTSRTSTPTTPTPTPILLLPPPPPKPHPHPTPGQSAHLFTDDIF